MKSLCHLKTHNMVNGLEVYNENADLHQYKACLAGKSHVQPFPHECQGRAEQERSDPEWSRVTLEWKRFDNKMGTTLVSAHALCLNLLSRVWLHISRGWNCYQELRRGMV